jgi:hypothetical protein
VHRKAEENRDRQRDMFIAGFGLGFAIGMVGGWLIATML